MSLAIIIVLGAVISSAIAINKGRNALGWAVLGALVPLISVIFVALLPPNPDPALAAQEV
jgi:hypothetical protein